MFLLLLIAPKQKNFCVTKDRVPLRGSAVRLAPALFISKPPGLRCPAFASGVAAPSQKTDRCPCSASAVSAAGSASAAQPATLLMCPPCRCATSPLRGEQVGNGSFYCNRTAKGAALSLPYHNLAATHGRILGSPPGRAGETPARAARLRGEPLGAREAQ